MNTVLACFAFLLGLLIDPAIANEKKPSDRVTLLLNFLPTGQHAPIAYGMQKGYFAAEGIDLEVLPGKGSHFAVQNANEGKVRFAFADSNSVAAAISNEGASVIVIGTFLINSQFGLVYVPHGKITKAKDLKDKKIGAYPTEAPRQFLPMYLESVGLKMSDVKEVLVQNPKDKIQLLAKGEVDAVGAGMGSLSIYSAAVGKPLAFLEYSQHLPLPGEGLLIHSKYLKDAKDRDLNCRMIRAMTRSYVAATEEPEKAGEAIVTMLKAEGKGASHAEDWRRVMRLANTRASLGNPISFSYKADWEKALAMMKKSGVIKETKPIERYITNEFVDCAKAGMSGELSRR